MQAGGPPDGCCRRLLTLSFKQLNEGPLNYYFDDPEHSRDNLVTENLYHKKIKQK
jgi:hypothetical protein